MKLKPVAFGLTLGILWGLSIFVRTWLAYLTGFSEIFLDAVVSSMYPGYDITPWGSVVGLCYGFVDFFIGGFAIAWLYNLLAGRA